MLHEALVACSMCKAYMWCVEGNGWMILCQIDTWQLFGQIESNVLKIEENKRRKNNE